MPIVQRVRLNGCTQKRNAQSTILMPVSAGTSTTDSPERNPVEWHKAVSGGKPSSHIDEFAHDGSRLYVRFRRGDVHSYEAPKNFVSAMKAAPSTGFFFNQFVKRRRSQRHTDMEKR